VANNRLGCGKTPGPRKHFPTRTREALSLCQPLPIRDYFKPSFFPAASRRIDSRMRLSRVSGRFAV
jgi:hypothetical protein